MNSLASLCCSPVVVDCGFCSRLAVKAVEFAIVLNFLASPLL